METIMPDDNSNNRGNPSKTKKNILIAAVVLLLAILLGLVLVITGSGGVEDEQSVSPQSGNSQVEQVIASYAANGVEITEDDVIVTVVKNDDGTEETKVEVSNTEAAAQMRQATNEKIQSTFNKVIPSVKASEVGSYANASDYGEQENQPGLEGDTYTSEDDEEDPTGLEDLSELVKLVNRTNAYLKEWVENAETRAEDLGTTNYCALLLDQRRTGAPSDDDYVYEEENADNSQNTYKSMNNNVNGQAFLGLNDPSAVTNYTSYRFYYKTTSSETLYQNYLKNAYYENDISLDITDYSVEDCDELYYDITYGSGLTLTYQAVLRLNVGDESIVFGLNNLKYFVLDIEPRTTTVVEEEEGQN